MPLAYSSRHVGDIAECYASPELALHTLGWQAKYDLDRMCEDELCCAYSKGELSFCNIVLQIIWLFFA